MRLRRLPRLDIWASRSTPPLRSTSAQACTRPQCRVRNEVRGQFGPTRDAVHAVHLLLCDATNVRKFAVFKEQQICIIGRCSSFSQPASVSRSRGQRASSEPPSVDQLRTRDQGCRTPLADRPPSKRGFVSGPRSPCTFENRGLHPSPTLAPRRFGLHATSFNALSTSLPQTLRL